MSLERIEKDSFFHKVYTVVRQVPPGKVTTYGAIAKHLGTGLSSRMVGWALNAAHSVHPPVPAQRVVNRQGLLTGRHHFPTPTLMEELLAAEGIEIIESKIVHFEKHFWDPGKELQELGL